MQSVETGVEILQFLNHFKEDSRSAGASKVSQIATMFQPQQDFEEKLECLGPSTVSVVRTESHVARFNTARALFEKMSEQKGGGGGGERRPLKEGSNKRIGSGSCGVGGVGRGTPSPSSSGGNPLSRSPSPCSPRSLIHSNGFSSYPTKPVSISGSPIPTISSLSSTSPPTPSTFHTSLNNPSITSVLSHQIGTNILSPRTFSEANDPSKGGRWAPVIKSEISKPEILKDRNVLEKHTTDKYGYNKTTTQSSKSSVSYPNEGSKLKNEEYVRYNTDSSRISSRENPSKNMKLDSDSKIEINSKFHSTNNFNNIDQCDSNKISRDYYNNKSDNIPSAKNSSSRSDNDSKPNKPTKPDLLSEKRLNNSSHLQNQKIIQRHKNWFHTFSKSKSPASSPNKTDLSNPTGSSVVGSRLQSSCNRSSYECEDKSNHINSSRKHIKEVIYQKRKSLDDLDSISSEEIQATHNDWRRERAAILAGRANSRLDPGEEADKTKSTEEKVRNYDNVSTLPSSWCPPKQYNAAVKSSRSPSTPSAISDSHHDSSLRHSPLSGGDNTSESGSRLSESGSNSGSFRDGYVVKREISEVHRSSFDSQRDLRGNNQNGVRGNRESSPSPSDSSSLSRRSDYSKGKPESRASSDLVNERLQRQSDERNMPSQETEESNNDLEADVKLRKFKAMSTEDVRTRRSFDVKLDTNDGSLKRNSYEIDRERRLKEWERKRIERGNRLSDEIKVHNIRVSDISAFTKNADKEKKENDEVIWVKRETNTGSLDSRRIKEDRKRREEDKIKEERQRKDEELERKRREALERTHREEKEREEIKRKKVEELERKKLEEIERQKVEEEEKRRQRELEKERRKELELERKRKQEEIAKELELRKLEEQKEKNRLKEKEEKERIRRELEEREKKEAEERARRLREEEERERLLKERREAEENIRKRREEEERSRQLKEQERQRELEEAEERARIQKEKEEEIIRQQKEEEERERIRIEKEEMERLEAEEKEKREMEEEKIRKQKEEAERERLQEEERRNKMTSQERMEEEERLKKEKDRLEIEKTKKRIAELKREREELQRQQLMRMQQILVDEQGTEKEKVVIEKEEVIRINLDEISNEERESESIAALDALVHGHQKLHQVSENSEQDSDSGINIVQTSIACADSRSVNKEIPKNIPIRQDSAEVVSVQEYLDENKSSNIEYALVGLDASELTDDVEVTDIEASDVDATEVDHSTSSNSSTSHITDKSISERPELTLAKSEERRMFKTESSLDEVLQTPVDEVYYDPTVTSAQYKIEFCTSPLGIAINQDESKTGSPYRSQTIDSSTLSSEFEPLPPPIPPHNVNPATIMSEGSETPPVCQNETNTSNDHVGAPLDDKLEQMADLMEYVDADPEVMTPEEEKNLLSHKADTSLLSDDQAKEVSQILAQTKDVQDGSCLSSQNYQPEVSNELPVIIVQPSGEEILRGSSPPVDYDDDDAEAESSGVPVGQVTDEGFVVRTKEVHYEDGIHYFEDGNFWIEVPGLQENDDEDDEDEFPEHIPFHKHTKLKFSTAPIQLFSTFSVTDYDRKNEDVDPVAASAEYELEKRVEKMEVFPVQIEKGEGGLGLSIIGMGVGADAGVEKLGIFVKTISPGGATDKDGRIKVNDQIIEVDNQSLVGVTQMYAASVLKNTNGSVNFLIGREQDPDNSEVAMLIRQSLMADMEREERRRALGGPNYDSTNGGAFESFSSPSGGDSPSEETSRNNISQYDEVGDVNPYGEEGCEDDYADSYGSCPSSPQPRTASSPPDALKSSAENSTSEMMVLGQHLMEVQHKNRLHEEEIVKLRSKITELERELGDKVEISKSLEDMTSRLIDIEDKLQSRQAEIATYQDMLEQSQGQYIVLEKKYYKAKKIIKEYQSRERDFLHREEYHITQLEEKDALYNSLVKALKDRVIQLEGDLIKAQQKAGLPVVLPPDLNAQSSNYIHSSHKGIISPDEQMNVDQKEPPRKPATLGTLDPDLSDTEGCDTQTSESSKASTVERKIPLKEELDVAVPPHELLDVSFSKAKGELAARGGLAKRQLPSLKKTASSSSAGSFDRSLDDSVDEGLPESHQQHLFSSTENSTVTISSSNVSSNSYTHHDEVFQQSINSSSQSSGSHSYSVSSSQHQNSQTNSFPQNNGFSRPPPPYHPPQGHNPPSYISPPQNQYSQQSQLPHGGQSHPPSYGNSHNESQHIVNVPHQSQSQPPPYQPPPSAPLSHRSLVTAETNTGRSDMPYRHPPPIARVQPVNRVEAPPEKPPTPTSPQYGPRTPQQQSLAHQLKTLLAEREANAEQLSTPQSPIKKSASMLMEDVRQAVIQADLSIGKKPMISAPIHMSSTAQVVSTGQFVQHRGSPVRNSGGDNSNSQQRISHDFGSWSPKSSRSNQNHSSSIVAPSNTSGVVLLSQRPIDSSLPPLSNDECNLSSSVDHLPSGSQGSLVEDESTSSFDSQPSPSHLQDRSRFPLYSREAVSVLDWSKEQVGQWLVLQGMEVHVGKFVVAGITGPRLVNIDTKDLKSMGLSTDEKNKIKRKVKELRQNLEKERKQIEKERKEREKLQKKAEKLAKEAEKRKK